MSIQQQYNLVPGQYSKEMASVKMMAHLKGMVKDLARALGRGLSTKKA